MLADRKPTIARTRGDRDERRDAVRTQVHWNAISLRRDPPADGERAGRSDRAQ